MKKGLVFLSMFFVGLMLSGIAALGFWVWHIDKTWSPLIEPRLREREQVGSVRVLARDKTGQSRWIGSLTAGRMEERQPLKLSEVPPQMVQSIVVLEDPRFLQHGGFDIWGILRAFVVNLGSFRFRQGGSTLTQQLVKNVFLTNERTLKRKFTELVLSALVENRFTKDEILEAYMNEVYLGQIGSIQIHGVGRAAEYYFGKKVDQLEIQEMALLAAMINGPGVYDPWKAPAKTKARRDRVLRALAEAKLILPEEYDEAVKKGLPSRTTFAAPTRAAYLMDALRQTLIAEKGELEIIRGGFDVNLALDLELQELAEKTLKERAQGLDPKFQGLIVAGDPRTCEVRAYAGGTSYSVTQLDRIRQSKRPIGSLMKPLEMARLLEEDPTLNLATVLDDRPLEWTFDAGHSKWKPSNYDNKFRGPVTLRTALEQSLNVPIVRVFFERNPTGALEGVFDPVRALGLDIPPERALPSALLGAIEQSPWTTLRAFLKLTRQALGLARDAGDFDCRLSLETRTDLETPAADASATKFGQKGARLTLAALEGALRRGTSKALGAKLPVNQPWAGKTGTSSDLRDAWYVAISPELVVLAWAGRDDNQQTKLTGASGAMPLAAPLVEDWAKREKIAPGWAWPAVTDVAWKPIVAKKMCKPSEVQQALVRSGNPEPASTTPPPEVFQRADGEFVYELFRAGAEPAECP